MDKSDQSKTILITGSNGLLGQKLVKQLCNHPEFKLIATSLGPNRIKNIQGFTYKSLDITNKQEVKHIFEKWNPDVVINTAAMTNVDACEDNKENCWKINVEAVDHLIEASILHNTHLIHLSTDFVFDGENGPYKETDQPNPLSYYGLSKYEAEERIQNSTLKHWAIARTIIVYGIAEAMSRSNIVLWAKQALAKGDTQPLNIVDDQFRSPTFAEDLAKGCILIAKKKATGIFHLSGRETMSILEMVQQIAQFFNLDATKINPIQSETLNQAAKRPPKTGFILDKAHKELGYNPITFEESLAILTDQLDKVN